jgi:hypothetical protein
MKIAGAQQHLLSDLDVADAAADCLDPPRNVIAGLAGSGGIHL